MRIPPRVSPPGRRVSSGNRLGRGRLSLALRAGAATWLLVAFGVTPVESQRRPAQPADLYRIVSVGSPSLAPAGDRVAFTVTRVREASDDRETSIWIRALRDGQPADPAFRFTAESFDASSPVWSPDGSLLAFSSQRGTDPDRIWFARVTPPGGEAFHIEGVRGLPIWSGDGRWIAFLADTATGPAPSRAGAVSPEAISRPADPTRFDGHVITHLNHRRDGSPDPMPHPSALRRRQLHVVPAGGGVAVRVTDFAHSVREAIWAPDGSALYVTVDEMEGEDGRAGSRTNIYRVPRDGGPVTALTQGDGARSALAISPDGRQLAFRSQPDYGAPTDILLLELDASGAPVGTPRNVTTEWPLTPGSVSWSPDGRTLRFIARTGGANHVFEVDVARAEVRQVTEGDRSLRGASYSADGRLVAYAAGDATRPDDIYIARSDGTREVRLTSFNDELLAQIQVQAPERLTWTVADGTTIEGWLIPPAGATPGPRYPMVLNIHGGPHAAYGYDFSLDFQIQSGSGFYVFYLNPRGSAGYGDDFQWAIDQGWGGTDEEDFIRGVAHVLERNPQIDPARLGVTGWSYGGFMTNWLTARTDLFAAAVTGASVVDWVSDAGTTDIWYTIHNEFGPLWETREVYSRLSPLWYVENVTAPTLILHGQYDVRVPYKNAEQWFRVLKMRGVPVELVRYPDTGHSLNRPWHTVDRLERTRSWFVHWLIDRSPAASSPQR